jgi:hypothetical protein
MVSMFCKLCFIGICHSLIKEKNLVYLFSEKKYKLSGDVGNSTNSLISYCCPCES